MFRTRTQPEGEYRQPLLNNRDDVVFDIDGSDDEDSTSALEPPQASSRSVRFEDEVQILGPPLRSTMASREAGVYVWASMLSVCSETQ